MFENPTFDTGQATDRDSSGLRALTWLDLAARFAAIRELRSTLARHRHGHAGSFARLAGQDKRCDERSVNHVDLGHGKADRAKPSGDEGAPHCVEPGHRGA
ncbi:hypothetical protein [Qipengyuania sp. JC766]|uniref:hypothetical protein n=1 Tax=Qipengyuania sp. JC766 TaxID=3232139 RepID=UPI003457C42C